MTPTPLHLLGFERPHLLVATGDITFGTSPPGPGPFLSCLFRPLDESGALSDGEPRELSLPLTQAFDLGIGDIVRPDGSVASDPRVRAYAARVDTASSWVASRREMVDSGLLPPTFQMAADQFAATSWILAPTAGIADVVALPAYAGVRTYYASNSKLAAAYADGTILDVLAGLTGDRRNRMRDGIATLHFPEGRLVSDVEPLGRLVFDAEARAIAEAFANRNLTAYRRRAPLTLNCAFPIRGETELRVRGLVWTSSKSGKRVLLAFDVESCSHPLPWEQLEVHFEAPSSGKADDRDPSGAGGSRGRVHDDFPDDFITLSPDAPVPAPQAPTIAMSRRATRFPNPGAGVIRTYRPVRHRKSGKGPGKLPTVAASPHRAAADGDARVRNVVTAAQSDIGAPEDHDDDSRAPLSPPAALALVQKALELVSHLDGGACSFLDVTGNPVQLGELVLNPVPQFTRSKSWPRIRGGGQARCVLIARVSREGSQVAVFEILRNPGESYSTITVTRADRGPLTDATAKILFDKICKAEGIPPDDDLSMGGMLRVKRISHRSPESIRRALLEILASPDEARLLAAA